jgi:hypothetical protein
MMLLSLYLLALLDGMLCGVRVSMGRCAFIRKRKYYGRAVIHGLLGAQLISIIALIALIAVASLSARRAELRSDLESAAGRMMWVFVPYAIVVVGSLALRMIPSTDLRSATSVFSLGPFTAIRPFVMVAGVLYGISGSHLLETRVLGIFVLALVLSMEYFLNRSAGRRQAREIEQIV